MNTTQHVLSASTVEDLARMGIDQICMYTIFYVATD